MNSKFYTEVTTHSIYALRTFDEDNNPIAFVGKSTSPLRRGRETGMQDRDLLSAFG